MNIINSKIKVFSIAMLLFTSLAGSTFAQNTFTTDELDGRINAINTAVPFLRIAPDARSGAMGDVGAAISPDANAMHYNAAKLAFVEKDLGLAVTYTPWLRSLQIDDIYLAYLSGFKRIDKIQTLGMSLRYFSLGEIFFTDIQGEPIGNFNPNEFAVDAAYSRKLSDVLSSGVTLRFIYSNLAAGQNVNGVPITAGTAAAADISFFYTDGISLGDRDGNLSVAVALQNIGNKVTYTKNVDKDFIPTNFASGVALKVEIDEYNEITFGLDINKLLVPTPDTVDANNNNIFDYKEKSPITGMMGSFSDAPGGFREEMQEFMIGLGAEYWYDKQFAVRAGYFNEHSLKGNRKYFTIGLGVKYNVFGLNFSYLVPTSTTRNPLDNTLRFSLLFDFAEFASEE